MARTLGLFAIVLAGCNSAGAPASIPPIHTRATAGPYGLVSPAPPPPAEPQPDPIEAAAPPVPPREVVCAVGGHAAPFADGCGHTRQRVFADTIRTKELGSFEAMSVDITWGFFATTGASAWVDVRDNGLVLTGFTDAGKERFAMKRRVEVLANRIWVRMGAPVTVEGASERGVQVRIQDDLPGVSSIDAEVPCDTLHYDRPRPFPITDGTMPAPQEPEGYAAPRGKTLKLRDAPDGKVIVTLSTNDPKQKRLELGLELVEVRKRWAHVRFETKHALFDGWIDAQAMSRDEGFGMGIELGSICTSSRDFGVVDAHRIATATRVTVGATPSHGPAGGVGALRGASFIVLELRDGFAAVVPMFSRIQPPDGQHFWVPEAVLQPI